MHYSSKVVSDSIMISVSKVMTFMKHIKMFPTRMRYGSVLPAILNGLKVRVRLQIRVLPATIGTEEIRHLGQKSG